VIETVPFDSGRWTWGPLEPVPTEHLGRSCVRVQGFAPVLSDVELEDGSIQVDLAVGHERAFHGVVWRAQDGENYESFFVRPHQVGNPDAIQYTPVCNGISSWQLYHGPGFWAPISFPLGEWFTVRVVFAGARAEVFVADMDEPALEIGGLKLPVRPGSVGLLVGGPAVHVADFRYDAGPVAFRGSMPEPVLRLEGIVPSWQVSDAFEEERVADALLLGPDLVAAREWTEVASEPSGLVDLSRVNGVRGDRNTALARAAIRSEAAETKRLRFGFSDRAVVFLNGRALFHGDDGYRSRDYRFLGSIGYHDCLYLALDEGVNELVAAVSEDFGGWGVQAHFDDAEGLTFAV
jgi:hypothetical protein